MATINYNGMELEEVTTPQIFDPPKKCVVWFDGDVDGEIKNVIAVLAKSSGLRCKAVTDEWSSFEHCALLPDPPKPRRATNRELSRWLAQGNGELTLGSEDSYGRGPYTKTNLYYSADEQDNPVPSECRVRKWSDIEWHEPTVDYIGLEDV